MSHSPAEIIAEVLIAFGIVEESTGWPIFISFLPDQPDESVCVYDTAGRFDGRIMRTGEKIEHPGIQVRVRGKNYKDTWTKANDIARSLDTQAGGISVELDPDNFYAVDNVSRDGPIIPLGIEAEDAKRRFHFTINAVTTIRNL